MAFPKSLADFLVTPGRTLSTFRLKRVVLGRARLGKRYSHHSAVGKVIHIGYKRESNDQSEEIRCVTIQS
jgi:hypothetical protein